MSRIAFGAVAVLLVAGAGTLLLVPRPSGGPPDLEAGAPAPEPAATEPESTGSAPELPRVFLDTGYTPPRGRAHAVPAGGDLQAALDRAEPGDLITLQAGAVFDGPFRLPDKSGAGVIVVRTSAPDASLPPPGTRIDPSYAQALPKLQSASGSVIIAAPRAHHYRFIGLEIRPRPGAFLYNLVLLGYDERSVGRVPHHLVFDRCYLHGDPVRGARRGIALNSRDTAVIDSYLSDFKEVGADSQAIAGWNGPGPFAIVNNYLEGAGENLIFGGDVPAIRHIVPADIEIRRNHFFKPLRWKIGEPGYEGTPWAVKNLFELKNARRVLLEDNLFENNWEHAQNGFAILLTVRTEADAARWAVVEDVTFRNNVVRRVAAGFNICGIDESSPGGHGRTRDVLIANNLFEEVGIAGWGGPGTLLQIYNGAAGIVIEHNTSLQRGSIIATDVAPSPGLVFKSNIAPHNEYGVFGGGKGVGQSALDFYYPGAVFESNVLAGVPAGALYPPGNFNAASLGTIGFADLAGGDYRLSPASPYRGAATDGRDIGADLDALSEALRAAQGRDPERSAAPDLGEGTPRASGRERTIHSGPEGRRRAADPPADHLPGGLDEESPPSLTDRAATLT
jgi:hypothetical protein